ncbi:hypothetical protein LS684_10780 [Cytobacillus spongiae]|uniref:hypothetical protein n=1 Tax=Cytobacillus spongiae TaxID=2901381 RepID=UPI001F2A75E4|nr:hypothetical protein [Cytobacillus spongiae]UII54184.1 hypothetical protein LS684_10780 [Cytobacillus spongiae]
MIKSLKWPFIVSILVAIGFINHSFSYIEFTGSEQFLFNRMLFYFIMIFSIFNAGMLTQKYVDSRKKRE